MRTFIQLKSFKKQLLLSLLLFIISFYSYAQELDWVKRTGSTGEDIAYGIAVDSAGNVYTIGTFKGTVNFNESGTPVELSSIGSNTDIFITKTHSNGNLVWAKSIGNSSAELGLDIALDNDGNVYVSGRFAGTVDFNPGVGVANLVSSSHDAFVLKLTTNGDYVWAKKMGGSGWDVANAIAVDNEKNVFVTGRFDGTSNFNTNSSTVPIELTALGQDIFLVKLDQNGNTIWARRYGSASDDWGQGVEVDANGAVYVTGFFREQVAFGTLPTNLITSVSNSRDAFLLKINSSGTEEWVKAIGGTSDDRGEKVRVDFEGDIILTGRVSGSNIAFGPIISLSPGGNFDAFVTKLSPDGNYTWAKNIGGTGNDYGLGLATDLEGSVYVTGNFSGTTDLNPGLCDLEFVSAGNIDAYIVKLDIDGFLIWGRQLGGSDADSGNAIAVGLNKNVYTVGYFTGTADFNANLGGHLITANGDKDVFLHKITNTNEVVQESVLPMNSFNLSGYVDGDYHRLKWTTNNNQLNKTFEIEKANDSGVFKSISRIEESNSIEHFYSEKSTLEKNSFYRIKQIDNNGELVYTNTILLSRKDFDTNNYNVYPNPVIDNSFTISSLNKDTFKDARISIYNLLGENIYSINNQDTHEILIDTFKWTPGVYVIEIQKGNKKNHFKIIKP